MKYCCKLDEGNGEMLNKCNIFTSKYYIYSYHLATAALPRLLCHLALWFFYVQCETQLFKCCSYETGKTNRRETREERWHDSVNIFRLQVIHMCFVCLFYRNHGEACCSYSLRLWSLWWHRDPRGLRCPRPSESCWSRSKATSAGQKKQVTMLQYSCLMSCRQDLLQFTVCSTFLSIFH